MSEHTLDAKALAMDIWNNGCQVTSEGVVGSNKYTATITPRTECLPIWTGKGADHDEALRNAYLAFKGQASAEPAPHDYLKSGVNAK